ncbi:MAG: FAD synthetase family protein [Eggerthellaceae bacterium]|nr:FAD synthetase family protein [Eggerthellaceae bacterium]
MKRPSEIASLEDALNAHAFEDSVCIIGVFDGVHVGHQMLIKEAQSYACAHNKKSVIFTFDIDPDEIFGSADFGKLLSNADRLKACANLGADLVVVAHFDKKFSQIEAQDFLDKFFAYPPFAIFVGPEFRFGAQAFGNVKTLKNWGKSKVFEKCFCDKSGERISSTRIRQELARGELKKAENLLKNKDSLA